MKKILILIFLSLAFSQELKVEGNLNVAGAVINDSLVQVIEDLPPKYAIEKMNIEQRDSLYSCLKKNTNLAFYLNYIPSLGHAYTGNGIRGLSQVIITIAGAEIITKKYRDSKNHYLIMYGYSWFWIFLYFHDVYYLSEDHNAKLYEYIYDKKYPKNNYTSIVQKFIDLVNNNKK